MTGFSVSPVGVFPAVADDGFPEFIQWLLNGTPLGGPDAQVINLTTNLTATRGVGENANVITIAAEGGSGGGSNMTWRATSGNDTLSLGDANNAVAYGNGTGLHHINVPLDNDDEDDIPVGSVILLYQEGSAAFLVSPASGVTINVRSGLSKQSFGQFATVSLIKRGANLYVLAGDLAAA